MAAHKIALVTDSTSDIPSEMAQELDIIKVPLYVIWSGEELKDGIDITAEQVYKRLLTDPVHPTTTQPTPQDFVDVFNRLKAEGAEEIVVPVISQGLSGTYNSVDQARAMVDIPIHLHNSMTTSMGLGWQVITAARVRAAGGDAKAMIAALERVRGQSATMLTVDTLEYLYRGGRIGNAAKTLGTLLNLKPLLYVDYRVGKVESGERTRTRKKGIDALYSKFFAALDTTKPLRITVLHANAPSEAEELAARIHRDYNPAELTITLATPVVGIHAGPGTLALCGMWE